MTASQESWNCVIYISYLKRGCRLSMMLWQGGAGFARDLSMPSVHSVPFLIPQHCASQCRKQRQVNYVAMVQCLAVMDTMPMQCPDMSPGLNVISTAASSSTARPSMVNAGATAYAGELPPAAIRHRYPHPYYPRTILVLSSYYTCTILVA